MTPAEFKQAYWPAAVEAAAGSPIFAQTVLSAAALESGWGKSELTTKYNNFFGIKWSQALHKDLPFATMRTREETKDGKSYYVNAKFVAFPSPADSFRGYIKFVTGPRYIRAGITKATTPVEQFEALKAAGYATDAKYVAKLTSVMKLLKLTAEVLKSSGNDVARGAAAIIQNPKLGIALAMGVTYFFF